MKIGILMPRSGIAGVWGPSCEAAAMVAIAELNAAGGILGDEVELAWGDSGVTPRQALEATDFLIGVREVDAIVGMHTSNMRDAVSQRLAGRVPYVYSAQYEGVRCGPSTVATGSVDGEILWPAIEWFIDNKGVDSFYLVGNDYVWPRMALGTARRLIRRRGRNLVGHAFVPLADHDPSAVIADIGRCRPDVVIEMLIGQTGIAFNRAFASAGLDQTVLRFGLALDETVLCGIGADSTQNLFSGSAYFASHHSRANDKFLERYHTFFGELAPPANAISVGCYEGIHVVAGLARNAGRRDGRTLAHLLDRPMPRSIARHALADSPAGEAPKIHIAAADGVTFSVLASL